ncbi:hypothetical protein MSG28_006637 [Choristoneura fumiferana]|uniref:Uncharacterized protein n=1 Tax=Choristoneura fumiferana TaxID=7141 RepID=A0ACC0JKQ5_CHOFU|nr:hypothetical protein MSG28_006637 [Choristoneura fumiferana]
MYRVSDHIKHRIVMMREDRIPILQIAEELGVMRSTVYLWVKRYREEGNVRNHASKGRPKRPFASGERCRWRKTAPLAIWRLERLLHLLYPWAGAGGGGRDLGRKRQPMNAKRQGLTGPNNMEIKRVLLLIDLNDASELDDSWLEDTDDAPRDRASVISPGDVSCCSLPIILSANNTEGQVLEQTETGRTTRSGREQPGTCFATYTKNVINEEPLYRQHVVARAAGAARGAGTQITKSFKLNNSTNECDYRDIVFDDTTFVPSLKDGDLDDGRKDKSRRECAPLECRPKFSTAIVVPI